MNQSENFTGPLNLGNPEVISIVDLAKKITHMTKSNSKIIFTDLPEDDPKQRIPNIKLAQKILNWNPSTNLKTGLSHTIKYFNL